MNGDDLERGHVGSPGFNLGFYSTFRQRRIGIFFNWGVLFPKFNNMDEHFEPQNQFDFVAAGIAFVYPVSRTVNFYYGLGPSVNLLIVSSEKSEAKLGSYLTGLGIGEDMGVSYRFSDRFSINIGRTLTWQFAAHRDMRQYDEDAAKDKYDNDDFHYHDGHSWIKEYTMIGIKPYISLGVHFW